MKHKSYILLYVLFCLCLGCAAKEQPVFSPEEKWNTDPEMRARYGTSENEAAIKELGPWKGWDYVAGKLIKSGLSEQEVQKAFLDPRMPPLVYVEFKLKPVETSLMYGHFTSAKHLERALTCFNDNYSDFLDAQKIFHVDPSVVAAILYIESGCGRNMGSQIVLNRLARVSSTGSDRNLTHNFELLSKTDGSVTKEQVTKRASYLEETFFPEVLALFEIAKKNKIDILAMKGSSAGAYGIGQFLPSAYLKYGVDGDKNGKVSLESMPDAIWSTAHFLASNGWKEKSSLHDKMKVLWTYNRSAAYGQAVIKVALNLKNSKRGTSAPPSSRK